MTCPVLAAFLGPHFDPVFSQTAVTSHAETVLAVDVPTVHRSARQAVVRVADAAVNGIGDPAQRVVLIQGRSGLGKTHSLVATLLELSRHGRTYPAVMQLSARIDPGQVSLWMLRKVLDEMGAAHFRAPGGATPLARLAERLWAHAAAADRRDYQAALEAENPQAAAAVVGRAVGQIRRALAPNGVEARDAPVMVALMLLADAGVLDFDRSGESRRFGRVLSFVGLARSEPDGLGVNEWLRGSAEVCRVAGYTLHPLATETDRQEVFARIVRIAAATGASMVIALDQIEAISRIGDRDLLTRVVATALQLVEACPQGLALVIAALHDTYDNAVRDHIEDSYRQRIELGEPPITLMPPDPATVAAVIDKRVAALLDRAGAAPDPEAPHKIAPDWLIRASQYQSLRDVFQSLREYRELCRRADRFVSEQEWHTKKPPPDPPLELDHFDKLWEDMTDAAIGSVSNYSDYDRVKMFVWLAEKAVEEVLTIGGVSVDEVELQDAAATRMVDLSFRDSNGNPVERWKIGFADAPNSGSKLLKQLRSVLDSATDAKPALLRNRKLPGVNDDGNPDRAPAALRKLQAGPALIDLFDAGGRVAMTTDKDWQRLDLARGFLADRADAPGFAEWRRQRRFLLEHAGIGQITRLLRPEGRGPAGRKPDGANGPPHSGAQAGATQGTGSDPDRDKREQIGTSGSERRDHTCLLVGHQSDEAAVHWSLDRTANPALPNYGFLVSGDAGQGKTQAIKSVVAQAVRLGCSALVFDFKNDYGDNGADRFAGDNGFTVVNLNDGLPFNPLRLAPRGPSGAQAIDHIFEVTAILAATLSFGDQQKTVFRDALTTAFEHLRVPLQDWVDPAKTPAPSLADVIRIVEQSDAKAGLPLVNRLGLLHGKHLLPADAAARLDFAALADSRTVLSFHALPNDTQLKRVLAELILMQLQGYMLRGDQPGALRRLLVFDEAWRVADSPRLIELAREGRAFGVGVVAGTQFADDLTADLTGNLATKLHLFNSDAVRRRKLVQAALGTTSGNRANAMLTLLGSLQKFEGVFVNQQYTPYVSLRVVPYFQFRS